MQRNKILLLMRGLLVAVILGCLFTAFYPCEAVEPLKAAPDSIVILKQKHELLLYRQHSLLRTYKVPWAWSP